MINILLICVMIIFSIEDIKHKSVPEKWLNLLILLTIVCIVVQVFIFPTLVTQVHKSVNSNLQIVKDSMSFSLLRTFSYNCLIKIKESTSSTGITFFQTEYYFQILRLSMRCIFGYLLIGLPYFISRKKGIGSADLIFFTAISIFFPIEAIWCAYFFAFVSGGLFLCSLKLMRPKKIVKTIPLMPFLSVGFIISMVLM
ncbi:MAG: prepilin peptidase [Caldisericia bacterium]|nr:prepilin peptidase [Caldisericia bacterium]